MSRVLLSGGAYQSRSVISGAQRSVNLYPEENPAASDPPVPVTHYPTPGLRLLNASQYVSTVRCLYTATNGDLYKVVGPFLFYVPPDWSEVLVGTIADKPTPVSMGDNGQTVVVVDGTNGYTIDMATRAFATIDDEAFYGADRVEFIDTFFAFNRPGTTQFYISESQATTFDPLDIAAKTGAADPISTIIASHRQLWVLGTLTTEIWYNAGTPDFAFGQQSGAFIEHGCVAKYSVAKQDVSVFWLSRDREGQGIVVRGTGYNVQRISTHAIEAAIQAYPRIDDAIGFCYQQQGHAFYVVTFPTADATWAFELKTGQWHEWAWTDPDGRLRRHRGNCCTFAYGTNVVGDWQNGSIYALDPDVYTDDGRPIVRIRTFPHLLKDGKRVSYQQFIADIQVGTMEDTSTGGSTGLVYDFSDDFSDDFLIEDDTPASEDPYGPPQIFLRWSDTRGASWGNPVARSLGGSGEYETSVSWRRLGMARDRVFELSWSAPMKTALNGAFVEAEAHGT